MVKDLTLKDTHIDWISKVPENWKILKSKFVFRNKSIKNNPYEPLLSVTQRDGVVVRSESDMNVWNPSDDVSGYKLIEPGDFVISLRSFEGGLELSKVRGIVSPAYTVLETIRKIDDHYFWWLMKSQQFIIELNKHVTGIRQGKNIGWDDFSNIYLTIPPLEEQNRISRYLDKKTSQIDSLIKKIEKKIELLKEQRTSLINQYVTKGLDPNVEMKDSGVEWIGEIPKHWNILKIKHVVKDGGFRSGPFGSALITNQLSDSGDWIVYSPENLRSDNVSDQLYVPDDRKKELEKYLVSVNDIVLPIVGSLNVSKVITEKDKPGIINQRLCRISLDPYKANINYISFLFKFSNLIQNQIEIEKKGSILDHITKEIIFNFIFPSPTDQKERDQLYEKVHSTNENFKVLIDKNKLKIKILREYRQSLISSVVTGKVRVTEGMV